ncbi:MAG: bifunctional 4-hydroxy-2-oxoglutarate aldolase/2-dehydro-3-deoxy-phosphogluconate aldolase [Phycisphaerae bacterium]
MDILAHIAESPILVAVHPQYARCMEKFCRFLEILSQEGYLAMELMARPLDSAVEVMKELRDLPQRKLVSIGLATIRTIGDAQQAIAAGSDFLVSPAFSERVLEASIEAGIPYLPAVSTMQDVQDVWEAFDRIGRKVSVLKLCPVEFMTPPYITSLGKCYPGITFCPTGTVPLQEIPRWAAMEFIGPPIESTYTPGEWIAEGRYEQIKERLRMLRHLSEVGKQTRRKS